jgi:hypothetical protein
MASSSISGSRFERGMAPSSPTGTDRSAIGLMKAICFYQQGKRIKPKVARETMSEQVEPTTCSSFLQDQLVEDKSRIVLNGMLS